MLELTTRKVLVGVAGDEDATGAIAYAAQEARRRGCGVHLVSIVHPVATSAEAASFNVLEGMLHSASASALHQAQRQLTHELGDEVAVTTEVIHGAVVPTLVALSAHAAVVVLQRQPRDGARIPTLSVTSGVAGRSHVPVVAVPVGWLATATATTDTDGAVLPVLVGLSDPIAGERVVRLALEEARARQAPLRVLHTWHFTDHYDDLVFEGEAGTRHETQLLADVTERLAPLLEEFPDVATLVRTQHAHVADALQAASGQAQLLVVGRHRSRIPLGRHLGSTTRAVLREARCPVMVVDPVPAVVRPDRAPELQQVGGPAT
ncbi:universal stress protein [Nocardioides psychrotolerans]|uniref:Nucleotide-binding universal stress protein, UspA family n=1 Tax=Nocardioides psychrotolerans TaxID=1005945 RepID=A0A1I3JYU8_9ACTN|nr:universal stress protein [Nocardioides psychrotolerans]GEP38364.1 universal stress protein [Nocardioides psychrotolerans]SFI65447.1 Nucleotide-binding universal stress protein, UspA family [Nocardioides psychrotolerans]